MSDEFVPPRVLKTKEDFDKALFDEPVFAFLDILGFSDLVKYNAHSTIADLYKKVINNVVANHNKFGKEIEKARVAKLGSSYKPSGLRVVNMSDSILLWTDNSSVSSLYDLLWGVQFLMMMGMKFGLPLRGAVTKGLISIFENEGSISIVGRPIVRAVELEKKQKWSGCKVDTNIVEYYSHFNEVVAMSGNIPSLENDNRILIKYDRIPVEENGEHKFDSGYVINWVYQSYLDEKDVVKSFSDHNKRKYENERIKQKTDFKLSNTLDFLEYCNGLKYVEYIPNR